MSAEFLFLFVIDTDTYAGNFERELCAYLTGQLGEGGVGEDEAECAEAELPREALSWFNEYATDRVDDDSDVRSPEMLWPTPGLFNDGFGTIWPDDAPPEAVQVAFAAAVRKTYGKNKKTVVFVKRYPAYYSVALFFTMRPPPEIVAVLKARAEVFAEEGAFRVTGYRLVTEIKTEQSEAL